MLASTVLGGTTEAMIFSHVSSLKGRLPDTAPSMTMFAALALPASRASAFASTPTTTSQLWRI